MNAQYVDPVAIRLAADGRGFERGIEYFRQGAVLSQRWQSDEHAILGTVRGSGASYYRCTISLDFSRLRQPIMRTSCSCPLKSGCKHVVATLLASNESLHRGPTGTRAGAGGGAADGGGAHGGTSTSAWRSLVAPPAASTAPASALALGVELRQRQSRAAARWETRRIMAVTPRALSANQADLLVGIRPLMRSPQTGKWIKGQASWDAARRPGGPFPLEQVRWFAEMYSIARDVFSIGAFADVSEWITLDTVASGLLWQHLRAAESLGIPMVSTQDSLDVAVADAASAVIEIAPGEAGALGVSAIITLDGRAVETSSVRVIARSGLYSFDTSSGRIDLTLASLPLGDALHALLSSGGAVAVPADDTDEFLRTVPARLARQADVRTTGGVQVPSAVAPVLLLSLNFERGNTATFSFSYDYAGIGRFAVAGRPVGAGRVATDPDRDEQAEAELWARAEPAWQHVDELVPAPSGTLRDVAAAEFVARVVPELQRRGVRLETTGTRPHYRELTGDPEITVSTVESADPDWFDLGVIITIDGRKIPFAPLFTALSRGKRKIMLSDGAYFSLAHPALDRLRELVEEAAELSEWETGARISKYQTELWADFEDVADESLPATSWRALAEGLRDVERIEPTPVPPRLQATLRPYQAAGFDWLAFLWQHRLGGILADDMGLGKTLQMLALIAHTRDVGERRPFLVVAPTSVITTWRDEAARFTPDLRIAAIEATDKKRAHSVADAAADADIVVTSYALLRLAEDEFAEVAWAGLILDEAQFVKNAQTKLYKAARSVRADVTFAITGTPLENSLTDLWSLLSLTAPGLFASARRFRDEYVGPIEKGKVPENQEGGPFRAKRLARLKRRIRPLVLRRTKELVASDLPAKAEQLLHIELNPAHRALYDTVLQRERQKVLGLLDDLDRNRFIVFRSLTLLRMLSLSPSLVDPANAAIASSKLEALSGQLLEVVAEGHRCLVFSQFTSYLAEVAARLERDGIDYVYLDGSTRDRGKVIEAFRSGEAPVFLISLKAGGFGLTLTEADYVFLLDPWWNPAAEAQAVDRAHRIGQTRTVMVYRMIAVGTIEEKVMALQQRKARLFRAVMDDDALFGQALTADDIRGLLEA